MHFLHSLTCCHGKITGTELEYNKFNQHQLRQILPAREGKNLPHLASIWFPLRHTEHKLCDILLWKKKTENKHRKQERYVCNHCCTGWSMISQVTPLHESHDASCSECRPQPCDRLQARLTALGCKCCSICHQTQPHLGLNMDTCAPLPIRQT